MCYLAFAPKKRKIKTMRFTFIMSLAFVGVVLITLLAIHTNASRQLVAGTVCVLLSIAMYASPLLIIGLVIRTKSVEYMPFFLALFNLLNALTWAAYSVVTRDIFVAIPNGIGCVCGFIQLTVYCIYRNSKAIPSTKIEDVSQTKPNDAVHGSSIQKVQEDSVVSTKVSSPRFLSLQRVSPRIDPALRVRCEDTLIIIDTLSKGASSSP
uniref:Bidirectional sugar transporter SWEET n=1 Tax=Picea sitchensis TaxID=3332 RepID=D5A9G7_PICSI|nr:unknown [Picea sitchensis]